MAEQSVEDVSNIIKAHKNAIFQQIWADPYLHALICDGLVNYLLIDKDSYGISDLQEDRKYFIVCETSVPVEATTPHRVLMMLNEMSHIASKYYFRNGMGEITAEDTYWITVPVLL